ncbi:hypothetical protein CGCSCA1_v013703 [Colletotrichum siamense]|nr:hypothetical protein CGCSCA1_v013703 [Colletotrichum siamense]
MWLQDFQSCPSLIYEEQHLPAIQSLLALFDHEFRYLCKVLENCQELPQDSVFELIVKRLRWAGEADNINQTSLRIGRLTSSMTAALSVTGRRNELVMRQEQSTRYDESQIRAQKIEYALEKMQGTLEKIADAQEKSYIERKPMSTLPAPQTQHPLESTLPKLLAFGELQPKASENVLDKILPLSRRSSLSNSLETITLLEHASKEVQSVDAVYQDVTMPLMLMKSGLNVAVDAAIAFGGLILPAANASFVSNIVNQILHQSHASSSFHLAAKTKQKLRENALSGIGNKSENRNYLEAWMGTFTIDSSSGRVHDGPGQAGMVGGSLCLTQHVKHDTPWGLLEAALVLRGNRIRSEVLSFRFYFRPIRELSNVNVAITYISHAAFSTAFVVASAVFYASDLVEFFHSFFSQPFKDAIKRRARSSHSFRTEQTSKLLKHLGNFDIPHYRIGHSLRLLQYPTSSHLQIMEKVKDADVPYSVRSLPHEPYSFVLVSC